MKKKRNTRKKVKRHLRPSIKRFLQIVLCLVLAVFLLIYGLKIIEKCFDSSRTACCNTPNCNVTNDAIAENQSNVENDYVWGIDISRWQNNLITTDWLISAKEKGLSFVFIQFGRRSEIDGEMSDFRTLACEYANMCETAQIPFGFYFLTEAKTYEEAWEEYSFIRNFYLEISYKYEYHKFPLMLDIEERKDSNKELQARGNALNLLINQLNSDLILYIGTYRYASLQNYIPTTATIWVADYRISNAEIHYPNSETGYFEMMERYGFEHFFPEDISSNVKMWQYAADTNLWLEKDLDTNGQGLDRSIMSIDFYEKYT